MRTSIGLALCAFLLASCAPGAPALKPTPTAAPTASPSAGPVQLALTKRWTLGPVADITVSPDAVYALYIDPSTEGAAGFSRATRLARIDRRTGAVSTAGPLPYAAHLAVAAGVVWMGVNLSTALVAIDATNLSVLRRVTLPDDGLPPSAPRLAAGGDTLWVACGTHVYRLSGGSGSILASQSLEGRPSTISLDSAGLRLYVGIIGVPVAAFSTITEFDPMTLRPVAGDTTGGGDLGGPQIAAGRDDLWVTYATGMLGQVEHRQASNLGKLPMASAPHTNGVRVYDVAGVVWVADQMAGQLQCLDPWTGAVRAAWSTDQGGLVAGDGSGLYLADISGAASFQLDSRCR